MSDQAKKALHEYSDDEIRGEWVRREQRLLGDPRVVVGPRAGEPVGWGGHLPGLEQNGN